MLQRELLSEADRGAYIEKPVIKGCAHLTVCGSGYTYYCGEFGIACAFSVAGGEDEFASAEIQFASAESETAITKTLAIASGTVVPSNIVADAGKIQLKAAYSDLPSQRNYLRARLYGKKYGPSEWSDFIPWRSAPANLPC